MNFMCIGQILIGAFFYEACQGGEVEARTGIEPV